MIDLQRTKAQMLEEIQAPQQRLVDISLENSEKDCVLPVAARLTMTGNTVAAFRLSRLNRFLKTRFAYLSPDQLDAELLTPLKRGLGNAYKWGNDRDQHKALRMEVIMTAAGAVVEIQDDGAGFDVARIVQQLHQGGHYYTNQGKGFADFHKIRSTISYADGGRTFLLCFLCFPQTDRRHSFLGAAVDEQVMGMRLAHTLPHFNNAQTTLQMCHIYVPEADEEQPPELKYVVAYGEQSAEEKKTLAATRYLRLTGRLLSPEKAAIDYHTATHLVQQRYNQQCTSQIPKPVAHLTDLGLVLYEFMPQLNLRKYASRCRDAGRFTEVVHQIGAGLRKFHQIATVAPAQRTTAGAAANRVASAHTDSIARVVEMVATTNLRQAQTIAHIYADIHPQLKAIAPLVHTVIHGDFRWINIWRDQDSFYFYHFEASKRAHPGYDVGSFLADLLRFCMIQEPNKLEWHLQSQHEFLNAYLEDTTPNWVSAIPLFTAEAMLLSLPRLLNNSPKKWYNQLDAYLDMCCDVMCR